MPLSKKQPSLLVNAVGHSRVVSYDSIKWKSIYIKKIEKFKLQFWKLLILFF
jgi:hypothetical protein